MTHKKNPKAKSNKIINGISGAAMILLYIGFGLVFYATAIIGLICIVSAFFNKESFLVSAGIGIGFIAFALGLNAVVTRAMSGAWKIHLPDIWIA